MSVWYPLEDLKCIQLMMMWELQNSTAIIKYIIIVWLLYKYIFISPRG